MRSFSSIVSAYTNKHNTIIRNNIFSHILNTPIHFVQEAHCFPNYNSTTVDGIFLKNINISYDSFPQEWEDHRAFYSKDNDQVCGDIIITGCIFKDCHSKKNGGSLLIEQYTDVMIHNTIFHNSSTESSRGGAAVIGNTIDPNQGIGISDHMLSKLDVQYCCFQNCYGSNELYGVALFIAAEETTLLYASTVNCPDEANKAEGAQFDIQAKNVSSSYVNVTSGHSKYCTGIEYRKATDGYFKYQTIFKNTGKYTNSFTSVTKDNLEISFSNYVSNTIVDTNEPNSPYPALVHIRLKPISINNFYFSQNNCPSNNGKFVSRGTEKDDANVVIKLSNCFSDNPENWLITENYLSTSSFIITDKIETYEIDLLKLGECAGQKTADILVVTSFFSPSNFFSDSKEFTQSKQLSNSNVFSNSNDFTYSQQFTQSLEIIDRKIPDGSKDDNKTNLGLAVGIPAAVLGAAAIALIVFFVVRHFKLSHINNEDIEMNDETNPSTTTSNPIYSQNQADDPFAEDFASK